MRWRFPGRASTHRGSVGRGVRSSRASGPSICAMVRRRPAAPRPRWPRSTRVPRGSSNPDSRDMPSGPCCAEVQPAATGPVLIAEQAVGIEVVGDALSQFRPRSPASTLLACVTSVRSAAVVSVGETQPGSTSIARHIARMWSSPTAPACNGVRQRRQLRWQRRAGQRPARPNPNRELEPSGDFVGW